MRRARIDGSIDRYATCEHACVKAAEPYRNGSGQVVVGDVDEPELRLGEVWQRAFEVVVGERQLQQARRGDGPRDGPGELVGGEVQLAEAAHGVERALGDGARQAVPRQVEHLEHGERGHVGEGAGERVVGEAERAKAREHGEDSQVGRAPRQAEPLQLQALHGAVAVARHAVPGGGVAPARARGAPVPQRARRRAVRPAQRVPERDQHVALLDALRGRRQEDGRGEGEDEGQGDADDVAVRPRPRHGDAGGAERVVRRDETNRAEASRCLHARGGGRLAGGAVTARRMHARPCASSWEEARAKLRVPRVHGSREWRGERRWRGEEMR